mmetsp:Transcript_7773/g.11530  ORF Transcript_7773/g.11530 Transcript_7773/m.11530 type:complete len:651 (+) Transcript_7773:89-2041(+)
MGGQEFLDRYKEKCRELMIEPLQHILNIDPNDKSTTLNLEELTLGEKNTIAVAYALKDNNKFVTIDLSESYMGDEACKAICETLQGSTVVKTLILKGGNIHASGASAIGKLLRLNRSIETLILEWNAVGMLQNGLNEIATALQSNDALVHLDLRNNKVSPEGAAVLASALKKNRNLTKLDLRWNSIGTSGGRQIEQCLQDNNTITDLPLSGNEIDYKTLQTIEQLLLRNKEIRITHEKERMISEKLQRQMSNITEKQNETIQNLESEMKSRDDTTKQALVEKEHNLESLKRSLQNERTVAQSMDKRLRDIELEKKQKENEIDVLKKYHKEEVDTLRKKVAQAEKLQEQTNRMLDQQTNDLSGLRERHDKLKIEFSEMSDQNRKFKDQLEAKDASIAKMKQTLQKHLDTGTSSKSKLLEAERKVDYLEKSVASLKVIEEEYHKLKLTVQEQQSTFENSQMELDRRAKDEITKQKRDWETKLSEEEKKTRRLESKIRLLQNEVNEMNDMNDKHQKDFERKIKSMQESVETSTMDKTKYQTEAEHLRLEIKQQNYTISNLQSSQKQLLKENNLKIDRLTQQLEAMIAQHQKDTQTYESKLATANEEIDVLQKEVRQLNFDKASSKEQYQQHLFKIENDVVAYLKKVVNLHQDS